jgi:hypothetical protein
VATKVTHIVGNPAVWRTLKGLDLTSYRCMLVGDGVAFARRLYRLTPTASQKEIFFLLFFALFLKKT